MKNQTLKWIGMIFVGVFSVILGIMAGKEKSATTYPIHIVDRRASEPVERDSKWKAGDTLYLKPGGGGLTNYKPKGEPIELGVIKADSGYETRTGTVRNIKTD